MPENRTLNGVPFLWDEEADRDLFGDIFQTGVDAFSNKSAKKNTPSSKDSPFISKGYPFSKDLSSYDPESLGRAFFSDGLVDTYHGLKVFDHAEIFEKLDVALKDEPYFYKGREIAVYLYTTKDEAELADKYQKLAPAKAEACLFAWVRSEDMLLKIKLGNELLDLASFDTATAMEAAIKTIPLATLEKKYISTKWLIDLFGKADAKLLDSLNVKTKEEIKEEKVNIGFVNIGASEDKKEKPLKTVNEKLGRNEINLTIGVFFDGTDNNRYKTELIYNRFIDPKTLEFREEDFRKLGEEFKKSKEDFRKLSKTPTVNNPKTNERIEVEEFMLDRDSSYLNPYSNVVLLHDAYKTNPLTTKNQDWVLKIYAQGVGTHAELDDNGIPTKYHADDEISNAFGRGAWGIIKQTEIAAQLMVQQIVRNLGNEDIVIKKFTIDVFGFSRGAAAARHYVNDFTTKSMPNIEYQPELPISAKNKPAKDVCWGYFGELLYAKGFTCPPVEIRFIGLFDCVAGDSLKYLTEQISKWPAYPPYFSPLALAIDATKNVAKIVEANLPKLNLSLKKTTAQILHIQSMNECRENFPLILCDAPASNQLVIDVLGVHSDVGGGYLNGDYETVIAFGDLSTDEEFKNLNLLKQSYENLFAVIANGTYRYNKDQIKIEYPYSHRHDFTPMDGSGKTEYIVKHYWLTDKRKISNKLSLVYFNAMLQYAVGKNVPFETDVKKWVKHSIGDNILPKMVNFYEIGKDEDLIQYSLLLKQIIDKKTVVSIPQKLKLNIFRKFVHISANYNKQILTKLKGDHDFGASILYVNRPAEDGVRVMMKP